MNKLIALFLIAYTVMIMPVKAQTFCNDEFNYSQSDVPNSYLNYAGAINGYLFGHNDYGDIGKAEFFNNPYTSGTLNTASFKFAVAKTNNPNATITVKVWDNTGLDGAGNPGAPGAVLQSQTVLINSIPTGGTDLVVTFSPAITVTTDFFIGITYAYAAGDTVALFANNDGLTTPGTSWEQWGPTSFPEVWYPLSDATNTWGVNNSLFISAELCYVCPTVNLSLTGTDNTSCTAANGTLTALATNGNAPYSYTDGSTTNTDGLFTGLVGGTYDITATDDVGCTATASETIGDPNVIIGTSNVQDNTSCAAANGAITATATDGTSPYSYTDGNLTNSNGQFTGLVGDTYDITVTDATGCTATVSETIIDNLPTVTLTEESNTDNTSCNNPNGAFEVSATGGAGGFTFEVNGQSNSTGIFTGLDDNTYTVTATGTDGCSGTLDVTIVDNTPTITVTEESNTDNTSCATPNGAFEVSATGGAGGFTFDVNGQSNSTGIFTGLADDTYTVTATGTDGCLGTLDVTIVDNTPTITITEESNTDNTSCANPNGAFEVSATGGAGGFTFDVNGQSNSIGIFTGLADDTYTVTATGTDGCSGTLDVTVLDNTPTITLTEEDNTDNTSCSNSNGAFEVSATGGTGNFTFSANGQSNSTGIFTGLAGGTYTVTASGSDGCEGTLPVTIADNLPAITVTEVSSTANTSCSTPNGAFEVNAAGGAGNFSYAITGQTNSNGVFTGLNGGTYTVTATGSDGCSGTLDVTVTSTTPVITVTISNIQDNTLCTGSNGEATIEATGGAAPYVIDINGQTIPLNPNPFTATAIPAGSYSGQVFDDNGCTGNFSFDVLDNAPAVTMVEQSVTPNTLCVGFNGELSVNATTGTSPYTYSLIGPGPINNQTGTFGSLAGNTYTVEVSDANGCTGTIDVIVPDNAPVITLQETANNPNTSCVSPNGSFTVTTSGGSGTYSYYDGVNFNTDGIFSSLAAGTYNVTATDDVNSCTGVIAVVVANNTATITLTETSNDDNTSCSTANGGFVVDATGGSAPYTYNNGISSNQDGIFTALPAGSYSVTATDGNGCSSTLQVTVLDNTPVISVSETSNTANASCTSPDGAVTLDASGGTAPYEYTDGVNINTDGIFSGLSGGSFDVTVTDDAGCTQVYTATVADNTPTIGVTPSGVVANTGCTVGNGEFTVTASGGASPYSYEITGASNSTGVFTGLLGGNYNVTATDDNGCSGVVSVSVTDNLPTISLTTTTTPASSASAADGSASVSATGGSGTYTYEWNNGGTTDVISNVVTSTYTVTVTDANGCSASASDSVGFVVGIATETAFAEVGIYPNPTKGNVSIKISVNEKLSVSLAMFNMLGEMILTETFGEVLVADKNIDLSNYSDGVYVMKISVGDETLTRRVVLNK
jgi:hypothetical protein